MKTAIRRPKINKPSKGMKTFFKQQKNSLMKAVNRAAKLIPIPKKQNWLTPRASRIRWMLRQRRSRYMPHQSNKECHRRIRQMSAGTHGYTKRPGVAIYMSV
jgi:hypothetical protein